MRSLFRFGIFGLLVSFPLKQAESSDRLLLCAGGNEMVLIDAAAAERGEPKVLWTWSGQSAAGIADEHRRWFNHLDECKPIGDGERILITASNSGCALVERATGNVLWYASATNAHSIELLPDNRVAVASSVSGDRLVLFDLSRGDKRLAEYPLPSAHGVVWDEKRRLVWALGFDELRSYELADWQTDHPKLVLGATHKLPDDGGHDLRAVPNSNDLILTTGGKVLLFDREKNAFRPHPTAGSLEHVKSVDIHPDDGHLVISLWKKELTLHNPAGTIRFTDRSPYKVRWFIASP